MNQAKEEMTSGDYEGANRTFRTLLNSKNVLPNEMSYLFAETLYMIGQYQNSHNFLDKYRDLTGKAGDYYEQSVQLDDMLEIQLGKIEDCGLCDHLGYTLVRCHNCNGEGHLVSDCNYCKGHGINKCLTCLGEGVTITLTALKNKSYKTCTTCEGEGFVACPVCKGKKHLDNSCGICLGSGKESSKGICLHPNLN